MSAFDGVTRSASGDLELQEPGFDFVPATAAPRFSFVRDFAASRVAVAGAALLLAFVLAALLAPWIVPQNPYDLARLDILDARLPPGSLSGDGTMHYLLGTDGQGRDMLSAIVYGLRISVTIGVVSTLIAAVIGISLGLVAGYAGGRIDALVMRIADIQLSFPSILVALILLAFLHPGLANIVIALIAVQWAYYARTVRGTALVERRKEYIEAARGLGLSTTRIVFRHLLPNCLPPLIVVATLQIASAIALEATLSFLGLGVPITEPSLGLLIANGFQVLFAGKYWISVYPGIALVLLIVALNLVADRLRDLLDPKLRDR
ncbi:MAG: ABC transporter permease [Burkholderiaceae bacterium]